MRLALWLYPARWRGRYGDEVTELIDAGRTSGADLVDLVVSAPIRSTLQEEASTVNSYLAAHPFRTAVVALLAITPTAVLVAASLLKYVAGAAGLFDAIEPAVTALNANSIAEKALLVGPYVGLTLAVLPFSRIRIGREGRRVTATAEFAVPVGNLLVGALAGALIVVMTLYWAVENL